jgi:hypothetical protein
MSHPSWHGIDACCEHAGTQYCQCWAYRPARTPTAQQVGDSLFREDNDMQKEPKVQAYEFPTELGDFRVYPLRQLKDGDSFNIFGWSFSPVMSNGYIAWNLLDGGIHNTDGEALSAAVRWAQENYDGPAIPAGVERVAPHWDRPGTTFNPGGWAYDNFLFHTLQEVIDYASKPSVS